MIIGIITYSIRPSSSVCGNTIGADGSGDYAKVITTDHPIDDFHDKVTKEFDKIAKLRCVCNIKYLENSETYSGSTITEIEL